MANTNRDPSPEQIAAACAEIRATWSPQEHFRRLRVDLRPTFTRADGIREGIDSDDYNRHHDAHEALTGKADT